MGIFHLSKVELFLGVDKFIADIATLQPLKRLLTSATVGDAINLQSHEIPYLKLTLENFKAQP